MPRSRTRTKRQKLSRERIETAALALIEKDGLADFSTRKLAAELGCEAMSIYHHFPSKAHLMDALVDRVLATMARPPAGGPWLERLRFFLFEFRAMALRYPQFFQFLALHRLNTRGGLAMLEGVLEILKSAGFGSEDTARLFRAVGYYLLGAALEEAAGYAKGPSAVEPVPDDVAARDFPLITAANPYFRPAEREATFALGLDILLAGVAARAPRKTPATARSRRTAR